MAEKHRSDIENENGANLPAAGGETGGCASGEERTRREARRRILTGGLAGAPLILTLSSRPALASICTASAMTSGNMSQVSEVTCQGYSPTYWKTSEYLCGNIFLVGPCNPIYELQGVSYAYSIPTIDELRNYLRDQRRNRTINSFKADQVNQYIKMLEYYPDTPPFGTPFAHVFGGGLIENGEMTMMQALWKDDAAPQPPDDDEGPAPLLAHCAAAYCNAREFGKDAFGYSTREIVDLVTTSMARDPVGLLETLKLLNERS